MIPILLVAACLLLAGIGLYRAVYMGAPGPSSMDHAWQGDGSSARPVSARTGSGFSGGHSGDGEAAQDIELSPGMRGMVPTPAPKSSDPLVRRARGVILDRLGGPAFGVSELAEELDISPRQLQRRLRDATGQTPVAFIRELRMERAQVLLAKGDQSVASVAWAVGISSPSYFARCFRKHFGVNPSEYGELDTVETIG